ncbi:MAG: type II toxin-antitoxin system VapC family toxin [Xanthobacteraceae bacterium]
MNTFVVDASIAIKWVVEEDGTPEALELRRQAKLIAPELLVGECANILRKKVQRDELAKDEALLAARLLQAADLELLPMRSLFEAATRMSIEIDHPAYDCVYLALAAESQCRFVTADERLVRKLAQSRARAIRTLAIGLREAVKS